MFATDIRHLEGFLRGENGTKEQLEFSMIFYFLQEDVVMLGTATTFASEDRITLEIAYDAHVSYNVLAGYGIWKQPCDGIGSKQCWFTMFFATGARQLFPCLDEPRAKATFDMRVARTEGWNTLFNTPVLYTEPVQGMSGWVWDIFATTPAMSTYTMALAIQDFASILASNNMTIWAMESHIQAGYADYAAEVGPQCVSITEKLYNTPYMLPKMDMMHINNYGGAMENRGLIMYQFDYLLYDSSLPDPDYDRKWDVLETIAHELSHQWYGNLVTCAWFDQLWLNEGFATYVSHVVADIVDPTIHSWDRFIAVKMAYVMMLDSRKNAWALSDPMTSMADVDRKLGTISYWKGGAVIRMMESFLGVETFNKGLTNYLHDLSYQTAEEEDLFLHLQEAGLEDGTWPQHYSIDGDQQVMEDFTQAMKTWTQQAGIPLLNLTIIGEDKVRISQAWYTNHGIIPGEKIWSIPVTIADLGPEAENDWDDTSPDIWITQVLI